MRLPSQKKILREDVKEAPDWIRGVIDPLNSFMETVSQALNKNITFTENIASFVKEVSYKTNSTYPLNQEKISFQNLLKSKPTGILVMQVYDKSNYQPAIGPVYIPWVEDSGDILIGTITGLEASKNYFIRMLVV